jgi:hypothetical protein
VPALAISRMQPCNHAISRHMGLGKPWCPSISALYLHLSSFSIAGCYWQNKPRLPRISAVGLEWGWSKALCMRPTWPFTGIYMSPLCRNFSWGDLKSDLHKGIVGNRTKQRNGEEGKSGHAFPADLAL